MKVYCEHCGEIEANKQWTKDGIEWCSWCMRANGDITKKELREIEYKRYTNE